MTAIAPYDRNQRLDVARAVGRRVGRESDPPGIGRLAAVRGGLFERFRPVNVPGPGRILMDAARPNRIGRRVVDRRAIRPAPLTPARGLTDLWISLPFMLVFVLGCLTLG